jgi:hypothetical protein
MSGNCFAHPMREHITLLSPAKIAIEAIAQFTQTDDLNRFLTIAISLFTSKPPSGQQQSFHICSH